MNCFFAMGDGGGKAAAEKSLVERFDLPREQPQGNLGGCAEMRGTKGQSARIKYGDGVAGLRVFRAVDIGGVNPDVTGGETISRTALDSKGRTLHVLSV